MRSTFLPGNIRKKVEREKQKSYVQDGCLYSHELNDDGLQPVDHILVGFSSGVAIL